MSCEHFVTFYPALVKKSVLGAHQANHVVLTGDPSAQGIKWLVWFCYQASYRLSLTLQGTDLVHKQLDNERIVKILRSRPCGFCPIPFLSRVPFLPPVWADTLTFRGSHDRLKCIVDKPVVPSQRPFADCRVRFDCSCHIIFAFPKLFPQSILRFLCKIVVFYPRRALPACCLIQCPRFSAGFRILMLVFNITRCSTLPCNFAWVFPRKSALCPWACILLVADVAGQS